MVRNFNGNDGRSDIEKLRESLSEVLEGNNKAVQELDSNLQTLLRTNAQVNQETVEGLETNLHASLLGHAEANQETVEGLGTNLHASLLEHAEANQTAVDSLKTQLSLDLQAYQIAINLLRQEIKVALRQNKNAIHNLRAELKAGLKEHELTNKEAVRGLGRKLLGGLKEHEQGLGRKLLKGLKEHEQHLAETLEESFRDSRETAKKHEEKLESLIALLGFGASIGIFSSTRIQQSFEDFIPIDCPKAGPIPCLAYSFFSMTSPFILGFIIALLLVGKIRNLFRQLESEPLAKKLQGKPVVVAITAERCSEECKNTIRKLRNLKEQGEKFHLQYFDVTNYLDDFKEYELNLMSLTRTAKLPTKKKRLMIVAKIGNSYHLRIFNRTGKMVIDKGKGEFSPDKMLVQQLDESLGSQTKRTLSGLVCPPQKRLMYFQTSEPSTSNQIVHHNHKSIHLDRATQNELIQKITSSLGHKASAKRAEELGLSSFFEANKNKPGTVAIRADL